MNNETDTIFIITWWLGRLKVYSHGASVKASSNDFAIEVYTTVEVSDASIRVNRSIGYYRTHSLHFEKIDVVAQCKWALNHTNCSRSKWRSILLKMYCIAPLKVLCSHGLFTTWKSVVTWDKFTSDHSYLYWIVLLCNITETHVAWGKSAVNMWQIQK